MKINTPKFRVSFPKVFKAEMNKLNGKLEYSVLALFPKDTDMAPLVKAFEAAVEEKWGADKSKHPKTIRKPFKKQDDMAKTDETTGKTFLPPGCEAGAVYMQFKSQQRPQVVQKNANGDIEEITDTSEFYGGCYAIASVNFSAYEAAGNCGVSAYLNNILKVGDGEPFGGKTSAATDFAQVSTKQSASSLFE